MPDETVADVLSTADVGLCPDPKNPLNDVSTMNKTMEYMAFGLPVVAFDLRETRVSAGEAASYVASPTMSRTSPRRSSTSSTTPTSAQRWVAPGARGSSKSWLAPPARGLPRRLRRRWSVARGTARHEPCCGRDLTTGRG